MLKVVIFAAELRGHEPQYVYHAGRALSFLPGAQTTLVLPQTARSFRDNEDLRRLGSLDAEIDFETPPVPGRGLRNASGRLRSLRTAIERHRPDFVFIPTGDLLAQATTAWNILPFIGPRVDTVIDTIIHGCRFAYNAESYLRTTRNKLSRHLLAHAPTETIKLLNFQALAYLEHTSPRLASRFELVPHPVDEHPPIEKSVARKALGMPEHGRVVGCVGVLNERKGIDLLLKAFASMSLEKSDRLLLVGRLSASLERLIADEYSSLVSQDRLVIRNRYVTGLEMATALCAMDLVCTPYREQYGIGSVILNANIMARPVLSSNSGWPLLVVERFGLGTTCDVHHMHGFASALEQGLREAPYFEPSVSSRRLAAYHGPSNFAAHITRKLREMLGLPLPSDLLVWQSVLASDACAPVVR